MSHKPRSEPRTKVLIRARLRGGGPDREVCLLDASARGMLATCASPPPRGAFLELIVGSHSFVGHVEWAGERRFGITLRERIDVARLAAGDLAGALPKLRASPRGGATASALSSGADSRIWGQRLQFGVLAAAGAAAALVLAQFVGGSLGGLQVAGRAMADSRAIHKPTFPR